MHLSVFALRDLIHGVSRTRHFKHWLHVLRGSHTAFPRRVWAAGSFQCRLFMPPTVIQHITSVIWTESHETSNMIGHFVKVFSKHDQYTKSGIFPFNYVTKYDTTRRIFIVRIFFEFIMPVLNYLNF